MNHKLSIVKGAALLTGAGLIVKLMGAAYRIPLARWIGSEGIGLYQMAYPIYLIFLSLSTAGLPIAISKIIAEETARGNINNRKKVFQSAVVLVFCLGLLGSLAMWLSAPWLAGRVVADPRAVYAMWALAPAIFFMSMMAALRGYFQGRQNMLPSAISQITEQIVRVSVALILAAILIHKGIEHAAAGAAFGATAGGMAGLAFLCFMYFKQRQVDKMQPVNAAINFKDNLQKMLPVIGRLLKFALPISIAVILMPLLQTLDTIIVPAKLQSIGYTVKQATSALGILGNCWAVIYLPMIVTGAVNTNMVPVIAAANAAGMKRLMVNNVQDGLRFALIYLVPVAVIFYLCGSWIYRIIYGVGGVEVLSWFAPAIIFLGLEQVTAGILQGLGRPNLPLLNFLIGAIFKIVVTFLCTGWPGLNLTGAALGTVCGAGLTACLNLAVVKKLIRVRLRFLPAVVVGGTLMTAAGWYLKRVLQLDFLWEFILIGCCGTLIYLGFLLISGGIRFQDLEEVKKFVMDRKEQSIKGNG